MKTILFLFRIFRRLAGQKFYLFLGMALLSGLFEGITIGLLLPLIQQDDPTAHSHQVLQQLFDSVGLNYSFTSLLLLICLVFTIRTLVLVSLEAISGKIQGEMLYDLRSAIATGISEMRYGEFLKKPLSYFSNALIVEFEKVVFSFKVFATLAVGAIFALVYLAYPLYTHPALTFTLLVILVPFGILLKHLTHLLKALSIRFSAASSGLHQAILQTLNWLKYFKATGTTQSALRHIRHRSFELSALKRKMITLNAGLNRGTELFGFLILCCVLYYQVVLLGEPLLSNLFFLYILHSALNRVMALQGSYRSLLESWGGLQVLVATERELEEKKESLVQTSGKIQPDFTQSLFLEDVSYSFPSGKKGLDRVTFEIRPQQLVGIVGASGSGKTTLMNLLTGLLEPAEGGILQGTVPIQSLNMAAYRSSIGYITQEGAVFNDTVFNNITLWDFRNPETESLVRKSLRAANVELLVDSLPQGLDTVLGDHGMTLSGGQRQRLCIARELYKQPRLLILDEATSALDRESEMSILDQVNAMKGERTILIVSHRLVALKDCDWIVVMHESRIVEQGSYDELCNGTGPFSTLMRASTIQ